MFFEPLCSAVKVRAKRWAIGCVIRQSLCYLGPNFFIPVCPRNVFLMHAFVFPQISHTSTAPRWKASLTRSLPSSSWPTENKTMKIVEERNLLLRYALSFERSQIAEPRSHFPPIFQSLKRTHWDAILALEKPTNTLKLERDEIIEQVRQTKRPT